MTSLNIVPEKLEVAVAPAYRARSLTMTRPEASGGPVVDGWWAVGDT